VLAAATRIPLEGAALVPAWACLSAGKLAALPPIPGVERLIVLADNDEAGRKAAEHVVAVWRTARREVMVLVPPTEGTDFNDLVLQEDNNAVA
jgi:DNA primase